MRTDQCQKSNRVPATRHEEVFNENQGSDLTRVNKDMTIAMRPSWPTSDRILFRRLPLSSSGCSLVRVGRRACARFENPEGVHIQPVNIIAARI